MDKKARILEMYIETAERIHDAIKCAEGTDPGSEERDHVERLFGERQAYGRILKELHGVEGKELQRILDGIYAGRR